MKKNETEGEKRRYKMVIYEAGELTKDVPCLGDDDGLLTGMNLVFARSLGVNRSWCQDWVTRTRLFCFCDRNKFEGKGCLLARDDVDEGSRIPRYLPRLELEGERG